VLKENSSWHEMFADGNKYWRGKIDDAAHWKRSQGSLPCETEQFIHFKKWGQV
jgi:hypothetical protein